MITDMNTVTNISKPNDNASTHHFKTDIQTLLQNSRKLLPFPEPFFDWYPAFGSFSKWRRKSPKVSTTATKRHSSAEIQSLTAVKLGKVTEFYILPNIKLLVVSFEFCPKKINGREIYKLESESDCDDWLRHRVPALTYSQAALCLLRAHCMQIVVHAKFL